MYYEISDWDQYCVSKPHDVLVILSDEKNPVNHEDSFYSYYVEVLLNARVENGQLYKAACWCEENCSGAWLTGKDISAFVNESDAVAFKLRWL